jgi:2-alkyl-3-oxoalkanoate reductase
MGNDGPVVLVTGATGALGSMTVATIIETRPEWRIITPVRTTSGSNGEAWDRITTMLDHTLIGGAREAEGRLHVMSGDVTEEGLGLAKPDLDLVLRHATHVIHIAGDTGFTTSDTTTRVTNVVGTQNAIDIADQVAAERFCQVSTAYVAGDVPGRVTEDATEIGTWRNAYEASRASAEAVVRSRRGWGRTLIVRPSIIAGSAVDGFTTRWDVFYPVLAGLARGDFRVLRAWATGLLDVVSVDYVAAAVVALLTDPAAGDATVHLTAGHDAITISELTDATSRLLDVAAPELVCPAEATVDELVSERRLSVEDTTLLRRIDAMYGAYFSVGTVFDNELARSLLGRYRLAPKPLPDYLDRLVAYGVASDWGRPDSTRRPPSRAQWLAQTQPWRFVRGRRNEA